MLKFASKPFSESNQKVETENKSCAENGNWQSLRAQVDVRNQHITAVCRNGWYRFSVAGKSKAGNLFIFTPNR